MKNLLIILLLVFAYTSCSPEKVYIPIQRTLTEYITNTDSLYIHDSIFYFIHTKKDTTIIHKYTEHIKEFYRTDTLIQKDTVPVILEIEKTVITNKLALWLKMLIYTGGVFILILIYNTLKLFKL